VPQLLSRVSDAWQKALSRPTPQPQFPLPKPRDRRERV